MLQFKPERQLFNCHSSHHVGYRVSQCVKYWVSHHVGYKNPYRNNMGEIKKAINPSCEN